MEIEYLVPIQYFRNGKDVNKAIMVRANPDNIWSLQSMASRKAKAGDICTIIKAVHHPFIKGEAECVFGCCTFKDTYNDYPKGPLFADPNRHSKSFWKSIGRQVDKRRNHANH